jgi:hypothetical protein
MLSQKVKNQMADIKPVTKSAYAHKYWHRYTSYAFAATDAIVPLVMQELPKAQLSLPIGFAIKDEQTFPVAVQGLQPGTNLLVGSDGRWLGPYVPAAYRGYPFVLADTEEGKQVLCVAEDSGLISDSEGEAFFTSEGEPAKALSDILAFLQQIHQDRQRTLHLCSVLHKHDLIQPWPIQLKVGAEEKRVEGLYRIDEKALNTLEYEAYLEVSKAGALTLAYCQLLSMQHLQNIARLSEARPQQEHEQSSTEVPDMEKIFGEKADDIFSYDF